MEYHDSCLLGDPLTVTEEPLTISNVPLDGATRAAYRFTDLYGKSLLDECPPLLQIPAALTVHTIPAPTAGSSSPFA